jgi:hypothetical protein
MRLPIDDLIDRPRLAKSLGRPPTPRELRDALPRGWVLDEDGRSARRDARMLFREGWMLLLCLVCFAAAAAGLFWWSFPRGSAGWIRLVGALAVLLVAGGLAAPILTRALVRRPDRDSP